MQTSASRVVDSGTSLNYQKPPLRERECRTSFRVAAVCATRARSNFGCAAIVNVHLPKDRVTLKHQNFGFIEFLGEEDADYAIKILNMIKLYGKPIRVNKVRSCARPLSSALLHHRSHSRS